MQVALDSEDIERIACRVAELLREQREDPTPQGWLDTRAAAKFAGCSVNSIRKATASREIEFRQDANGGKCWFKAEWIDAWRGQ